MGGGGGGGGDGKIGALAVAPGRVCFFGEEVTEVFIQ